MGEIFKPQIPAERRQETLDTLCRYEEHYMQLLKRYAKEIGEIQAMMESLRREREDFYNKVLPETERKINANEGISDEAKAQWFAEFRANMENSLRISEELISHYVTANLEEFRGKMEEALMWK